MTYSNVYFDNASIQMSWKSLHLQDSLHLDENSDASSVSSRSSEDDELRERLGNLVPFTFTT
jgi:hypothetical protein